MMLVNILTTGAMEPKISCNSNVMVGRRSRQRMMGGCEMQQRIPIKRSNPPNRNRLISTLLTYLPGAWIEPKNNELISLYRLRYKMAMEEKKFDTAIIFLNKILELD